ncbi:MAG TPA: hypothetical protein VKE74_29700, partial [Gemmataceae bacterium]|nr:hypothetical protein [Gemmataceae bacterium]
VYPLRILCRIEPANRWRISPRGAGTPVDVLLTMRVALFYASLSSRPARRIVATMRKAVKLELDNVPAVVQGKRA